MRYLPLSVAVSVGCMLLPSVAFGQAGTRPDPDSPAGVEYQLPLDQARQNAAGDGKRNGDGKGDARVRAPLFGAGIAARGGDDGGSGDGGRSGSGAAGDGSGDGAGAAGGGDASGGASGGSADHASGKSSSGKPDVRQSGVVSSDSDDGSGTLRIAGIALGVLLLGGLLGLALRRGLDQPGT